MSIMEKNLPNANSIESGDYLRMVTSDGNSKKIDKTEAIGYDVQTSTTKSTIFDGSATTASQPDALISITIDADWSSSSEPPETITVTFDGVEYTCNRTYESSIPGYFYGATVDINNNTIDFSNYPFAMFLSNNQTMLYTETAGTYTVKIEADVSSDTITTTDDFEKAVGSIASGGIMVCYPTYDEDLEAYALNKTYDEIITAINKGVLPLIINEDSPQYYIYTLSSYGRELCKEGAVGSTAFVKFIPLAGSLSPLIFYSESNNENMTDVSPCADK